MNKKSEIKIALYTIFLSVFLGNLVAILNIFKIYRYDISYNIILDIHYEMSIYSLKLGVIAVIAGFYYRKRLECENKKEGK